MRAASRNRRATVPRQQIGVVQAEALLHEPALLSVLQRPLKDDGLFVRRALVIVQDDVMDLQLRPVGQAPGQLRAGEAFCLREIEIREIAEDARQENAVSAGERPRAFVIPGLRRLNQSGEIRRAKVSP